MLTPADLLSLRGVFCGLALLFACLVVSHVVVLRLIPAAASSTRATGTAIFACWLFIACFHVLASLGIFRLWVALPLWLLAATLTLAWDRRSGPRFAASARETGTAALGLLREHPYIIGLTAALAVIRLLRGLVAPPLAWDLLTYHLVKVARWIQTGGFAPEKAPDAWGAYEYFPPNGDALWAWCMLPFRGDAALALGSFLVWGACWVASYALLMELGATRKRAAPGSAAMVLIPSAINFVTAAYVENTMLLASLGGAVYLLRFLRSGRISEGVVALAALAVGAGIKAVGVPALLVGAGIIFAAAFFRRLPWRLLGALALGAAAVVSIAIPPYLRAFRERGQPFYPLPFAFAGKLFAHGNHLTELAHAGTLSAGINRFKANELWERLFVPEGMGREFLNLGPAALLLLVLGAIGAIRFLLRPGKRLITLFLLAASLLTVTGLFAPSTRGLRTYWAGVFGRFLLAPLDFVAALGAAQQGPFVLPLLGAAVGVGWYLGFPRSWGIEDTIGTAQLTGGLVLLGALAGIGLLLRGRRRYAVSAATLVLAIAAAGLLWGRIRARWRYPIYEANWAGRSYDLNPPNRSYGSAFAIWAYLDRPVGRRLAVTAGWDAIGHNWFRYPLFGSRLQNTVAYVAPTDDGSIVDYRDARENLHRFHAEAWVRRLLDQRVDEVVLLTPATVEEYWVRALPMIFVLEASSPDRRNNVFRFDADGASYWLEAGAPLPEICIEVPWASPS